LDDGALIGMRAVVARLYCGDQSMDRTYRPFHALILGGLAALCYRLLLISPDLAHHPQYGNFVWPTVGLGLGFLFSKSEWITTSLLNMRWLRKLWAQSDDIEGDWPLVVVDGKSGTLVYYGFMTIGYKKGFLDVHGDDWFPDGVRTFPFQSKQSQYADGVLHYWYEQGDGLTQRGYTYIHFFPRDAVAAHHTGVFIDKDHPNVRFYALKKSYGWREKRPDSKEKKREMALAFAKSMLPMTAMLVQTPVNADWTPPSAAPSKAAAAA
jgi:hypothetical protein